MSEWTAPKANFCACILCILDDRYYSVSKALSYFNIPFSQDTEIDKNSKWKNRPPKEELFRMYETMYQYEIAKHYKVSQALISRWIKEYKEGLEGTKNRRIYIDNAEYDKLKAKGLNNTEIAKALGVSKSKITTYKRERGIK